MAEIGSIIDGKFEILKLIGQGGMSKVYLAMDQRLNKQWAIKEIVKNGRDTNNEIVVQSAIAEANMIKNLDHPALVRILDIIDSGNVIYIIEDYVEGEPLNNVLDESGAQSQEFVIDWAKQLCDVLDYLHTRNPAIIYRDMKPANVMLKPDGNIKVIDFGIAREYKENNSADTTCLGTKGYAAPEQFGGKGQTDARTDIYCLGVTLYHLITGQNPCEPPYELYPIRHWNPALSGGLERIIQKCTQLNPNDRYQSCAELMYALEHYEEEDDAYKASEKKKLNTFIGMAGATITCLLVGTLGMIMNQSTINGSYDTLVKNNTVADYQTAISLKPGEIDDYNLKDVNPERKDAYNGIITYYELNEFTVKDEQVLRSCLTQENLNKIQNDPYYAKLMYRVGMLYMFNYKVVDESGSVVDSPVTRAKLAVDWFQRAINAVDAGTSKDDGFYSIAKVYMQIGTFYQTLESSVSKGEDAGKYKAHWDDIHTMLDLISKDSGKTEFVELSVYKVAVYSMEKYARKFQGDGISKETFQSTYDDIVKRVNVVNATSEETTIPLKTEIIGRFESVQRNINLAYGNSGGDVNG